MPRAPHNRTLTLTDEERSHYRTRHLTLSSPATVDQICDRTICQDLAIVSPRLPDRFVDGVNEHQALNNRALGIL